MKTILTAALLSLVLLTPSYAQKTVNAKQKLKVVLPEGSGTNAVSVAWNPKAKVYYTCIGGNPRFPLYTFNKKGKITHTTESRIDTRGFWFNENQNRIEGTAYSGANYGPGYYYRTVDTKGIPGEDNYVKFPEMTEEVSDYSIPAYDKDRDELLYIEEDIVTRISHTDGSKKGTLTLKLPSGVYWSSSNVTSLVYTGKKGEEYGIYDYKNGKIYLFDYTTGDATKTVVLPEEAPDPEYYCFAYANNMFWVFSTLSRTWYAFSHP